MIGRPMGIPKTGVFGLLDLVGIDLMPHVAASMTGTLPARTTYVPRPSSRPGADHAHDRGGLHRPQGQGRLLPLRQISAAAESRRRSTSRPATTAPSDKPQLDSVAAAKRGLRALVEHPDRAGSYAWARAGGDAGLRRGAGAGDRRRHRGESMQAMRLGYNWKFGPFELIDQLGAGLAGRMRWTRRAARCRRCCEAGAGARFYRVEDGKLQYLGHRRRLRTIGAAAGRRAAAGRHQARRRSRSPRNGSRLALGHRRRRRLPRVHSQDERAGRRHRSS